MHKVLALYPHPKDPVHFKRYYEGTHLPLAQELPGLISIRHSFAVQGFGAHSSYFCTSRALHTAPLRVATRPFPSE
jgi:uncharacterized protein (TIGR02118 family)